MYPKYLATLLFCVIVGEAWTRSTRTAYPSQCRGNQFRCVSDGEMTCIPDYWKCDHYNDCDNGEDEAECSKQAGCSGNDFLCADGTCIPDDWTCDDDDDCFDGDDEASTLCSTNSTSSEDSQAAPAQGRNHGNTHHSNSHHGLQHFRFRHHRRHHMS